jgi:hypothetical protein
MWSPNALLSEHGVALERRRAAAATAAEAARARERAAGIRAEMEGCGEDGERDGEWVREVLGQM